MTRITVPNKQEYELPAKTQRLSPVERNPVTYALCACIIFPGMGFPSLFPDFCLNYPALLF